MATEVEGIIQRKRQRLWDNNDTNNSRSVDVISSSSKNLSSSESSNVVVGKSNVVRGYEIQDASFGSVTTSMKNKEEREGSDRGGGESRHYSRHPKKQSQPRDQNYSHHYHSHGGRSRSGNQPYRSDKGRESGSHNSGRFDRHIPKPLPRANHSPSAKSSHGPAVERQDVYIPPAKRRKLENSRSASQTGSLDQVTDKTDVNSENLNPFNNSDNLNNSHESQNLNNLNNLNNSRNSNEPNGRTGILAPNTDQLSRLVQKESWDEQCRVVHGTVNRLNSSTIKPLIHDLFAKNVNLVRMRGVLCRSVLLAASSSLRYSPVYASFISVLSSKLPEIGELLVRRTVHAFQKSYRHRDKERCLAVVTFMGHLFHHRVVHELLILQVLAVLLDGHTPTDDGVEVAIHLLQVTGYTLLELSPAGVRAVMERLRALLHGGTFRNNPRIEIQLEALFRLRKQGFVGKNSLNNNNGVENPYYPPIPEDLDLVEVDDQITFEDITLDDDEDGDDDDENHNNHKSLKHPEEQLDSFQFFDPVEYENNEKEWNEIRNEILGITGDDDNDDDSKSENSSDNHSDESSDDESDNHQHQINDPAPMSTALTTTTTATTVKVQDLSEADLVHLRRTIYLTIMSSATYEECAHKLAMIEIPADREEELVNMIIECCSQERTFLRYYGLIASRFCLLHNDRWKRSFVKAFEHQYTTIHRLETNKLRNVAKLFAHLFHTDSIPWNILHIVHLNEDETTSSSRIFLKIILQEMAQQLGIERLMKRFHIHDHNHNDTNTTSDTSDIKLNSQNNDSTAPKKIHPPFHHNRQQNSNVNDHFDDWYKGMFPMDLSNVRNTKYAINFYTSIGLGPLTDGLREFVKKAPQLILEAETAKQHLHQKQEQERLALLAASKQNKAKRGYKDDSESTSDDDSSTSSSSTSTSSSSSSTSRSSSSSSDSRSSYSRSSYSSSSSTSSESDSNDKRRSKSRSRYDKRGVSTSDRGRRTRREQQSSRTSSSRERQRRQQQRRKKSDDSFSSVDSHSRNKDHKKNISNGKTRNSINYQKDDERRRSSQYHRSRSVSTSNSSCSSSSDSSTSTTKGDVKRQRIDNRKESKGQVQRRRQRKSPPHPQSLLADGSGKMSSSTGSYTSSSENTTDSRSSFEAKTRRRQYSPPQDSKQDSKTSRIVKDVNFNHSTLAPSFDKNASDIADDKVKLVPENENSDDIDKTTTSNTMNAIASDKKPNDRSSSTTTITKNSHSELHDDSSDKDESTRHQQSHSQRSRSQKVRSSDNQRQRSRSYSSSSSSYSSSSSSSSRKYNRRQSKVGKGFRKGDTEKDIPRRRRSSTSESSTNSQKSTSDNHKNQHRNRTQSTLDKAHCAFERNDEVEKNNKDNRSDHDDVHTAEAEVGFSLGEEKSMKVLEHSTGNDERPNSNDHAEE